MTSSTSQDPYAGFRHPRPELKDPSQTCEKCGARMLYHDLDPQRRHNGYTCAMCGTEQTLKDGSKSTIKVARG